MRATVRPGCSTKSVQTLPGSKIASYTDAERS